jgi:DNA-binding MarR family transcriptional regulator
MKNDQVNRELFEIMIEIKQIVEHMYQCSGDDSALSILQFRALRFLFLNENATSSQLASDVDISPSSSAQLADRLEKLGFLKRFHDEKDRRIVRLCITDEGKKELQRLKESMYQTVNSIYSCLSEKDLQEFLRIHKILLASLEKTIKHK